MSERRLDRIARIAADLGAIQCWRQASRKLRARMRRRPTKVARRRPITED